MCVADYTISSVHFTAVCRVPRQVGNLSYSWLRIWYDVILDMAEYMLCLVTAEEKRTRM